MNIKDKVAVVTGAARGIGREIAGRIADAGGHVAVVDVEADAAAETAAELSSRGVKSVSYRCDVSDFEEVTALGDRVHEELGAVSILVNNAGIARDQLLMRMKPEDWKLVLDVNLTGTFNFCKVFGVPMLKRREGCIVSIASVVGQTGNAGQANYAASKAGVVGLTKSLAKEFAGRGVRVNAIAPGFIRTAMTERLPVEVQEQMKVQIPIGRFGEPSDVADVTMFLLSDWAEYVTGQTINCDGGMVMAR